MPTLFQHRTLSRTHPRFSKEKISNAKLRLCIWNRRKKSYETVTSFVYLLAFLQLKLDVNMAGNFSNFDWLKCYDVNQHVSAVATEFSGSMLNLVKLNSYCSTFLTVYLVETNVTKFNILLKEKLPFLENFRNPCWIERLPEMTDPYSILPHNFEMLPFNPNRMKNVFFHFIQ